MRKAADVYDMTDDISYRRLPLSIAVARGLALFLGGFSLLNIVGELRHSGFDANLWWIDLRLLGPWLSRSLPALAAVLLLAWDIWRSQGSLRRTITGLVTTLLLAAALLVYYAGPLA